MSTTSAAPTDEELAARLAGPQVSGRDRGMAQDACLQLYERYARRLRAFLASRAPGLSEEALDDVHQQVWLHVWDRAARHFHGGNFRAWLFRVAVNCLHDWFRRKPRETAEEVDARPDPRLPASDQGLVDEEHRAILQGCLGRLPPDWAPVMKARLAGLGYPEICASLGLTSQQAYKYFHNALKQLAECVQRATA